MAVAALNALSERLAALSPGALWVGFSGGMDSTVLLHMLASLPAARERGLTALHVCHNLHTDADDWARRCETFAASLDVPFERIDVTVSGIETEGLEAAARRARHAAFAQHLPAPGVLALAHHRDDQAETLLLRLLHGAGHEGLAGMKMLRPLRRNDAARWLWRPLLDVPRATLAGYAREHALHHIDDPANAEQRYLRNRLRHSVLPALNATFPEADARIAAAAQRLREEADALDALALDLLRRHHDAADGSLACMPLRTSPPALARRLVGAWLDARGLPRPPPGIWSRLFPDLVNARQDATPSLAWRGARLRRYRDRLYADTGDSSAGWSLAWDGMAPLALPNGLGVFEFESDSTTLPFWREPGTNSVIPAKAGMTRKSGPFETPWHVRPRQGGEILHFHGHRRVVKKLLQEAGLPPWQRDALPFLFDAQGRLLSIAARWNDDGFSHQLAQTGARLVLRHD